MIGCLRKTTTYVVAKPLVHIISIKSYASTKEMIKFITYSEIFTILSSNALRVFLFSSDIIHRKQTMIISRFANNLKLTFETFTMVYVFQK